VRQKLLDAKVLEETMADEKAMRVELGVIDPFELVAELSKVFGSDLWVNGKLCYESGREVERSKVLEEYDLRAE
jgi:hypothetical protein